MTSRQLANLSVLIALVATSACTGMRDPNAVRIDAAFSEAADPGDAFGGQVPGEAGVPFEIRTIVSTDRAARWSRGDFFLAAVDVGNESGTTRYGSYGGVKFRLETDWDFWIVPAVVNEFVPYDSNRRYYFAKSVGRLKIFCDDQDKLVFTAAGNASDTIRIRTRTVSEKQANSVQVRFGRFRGPDSKRFRCARE